jgi:hypothetical protein
MLDLAARLLQNGAPFRKIKLDQAFKIVLRGEREALKRLFEKLGFAIGKHHWTVERWLSEVARFSQHPYFEGVEFSKDEIAKMTLLLYPVFGATKKSPTNPVIFKALGSNKSSREAAVKTFHAIFENNNKNLRRSYYDSPLIQKLYPFFLDQMTYDCVFTKAEPKADVYHSYRQVTKLCETKLVPRPEWFKLLFPTH